MTTILCVRKDNQIVMAGDGQVSMQNTIMKPSARKLRNTFDGKVIAGFAGSTADAFTLFEKFDEVSLAAELVSQLLGFVRVHLLKQESICLEVTNK